MPVYPFIHLHPYQSYRPKWCQHSIFEGLDCCWGLALAVDRGKEKKFLKDKCRSCNLSEHYVAECNCHKFEHDISDVWFCDIHGMVTRGEENQKEKRG